MPAFLQLRSLKLRLLLPYAALIVLLTCVIGGMTYWAGARTVTNLSDRMLKEMASRMRQSIQYHVSGSAAVLEAAFPRGMAASPDINANWQELRNRLWAATTLHPRTNSYVYYGNGWPRCRAETSGRWLCRVACANSRHAASPILQPCQH